MAAVLAVGMIDQGNTDEIGWFDGKKDTTGIACELIRDSLR